MITHHNDLALFQPFEVHTQDIYWDESWLFLRAQFKCPDTNELYADGISRVMLRKGRERVHPQRLYREMGVFDAEDKDEVPLVVQEYLKWDAASEASMKQTAAQNAITFSSNKSAAVLSSTSMNLPFDTPYADAAKQQ